MDVNYSNEKELSIGEDFFDEMNSAVLDLNIINKDKKNKSTLFVKESLLPNKYSQKTISKFYRNDSNISYLKKVSDYYEIDVLVFSHIKPHKKKSSFKISSLVYKKNAKKVLKYSKTVSFNKDDYSLNAKSIKKIKKKLIKFIDK